MKRLEKRYSAKYGASPTANLAYINQHGPEAFLRKVDAEMTCPNCGSLFSMHRWECPSCGHPRNKND
jgi:rubrerythrin